MRSPTRASELVTDVQEASLPPVREEDRHRPRGAAGRSRPEVLTADIRASARKRLRPFAPRRVRSAQVSAWFDGRAAPKARTAAPAQGVYGQRVRGWTSTA